MKKYILLLLLVSAFTSGGCGGSSTSSLQADSPPEHDTAPKISAPFDSDGDGVPDAFRYYDAGWSGRDNPDGGEACTVPYLNYIASSDTNIDGTFTARIRLTQGHEYIMKYSHSGRPLTESYLDFTIHTPDKNELVFDFGFELDSADEPAPEIQQEYSITVNTDEISETQEEDIDSSDTGDIAKHVTVSASIDIIPPENPCIISYTFTAPQTGIYEFTFSEKDFSPVSHDMPYELRIYSSDDEAVTTLGNISLTQREMLDLQRVLLRYADKFNSDGLPVSFRPEFTSEDVYMNLIQSFIDENLTASGMKAAADDGAYIKPVVYDVPYDSAFKEGAGFYASSGVKALSMKAFQKFVLPTPQTGAYLPVAAHFKTEEIITEEEHNREQELQDMSSFALYKNALGDREMTATNVRLAQISKNVIINYDVLEHEPRIVDVNTVQLYSGAMSLLKRSYKDFREEYGDYFVAGYTWGMRFRAVISVTCESSSVLDKVCGLIKTMAAKAQSGMIYSSELREIESIANQHTVNISIEDISVDGEGPHRKSLSTVSSLGVIASGLASFSRSVQTATKNDYVRLKACFMRFREIPAAKEFIPALLPISRNHFNAIVEMNRTIFRTRCSYNALLSIPVTNLVDGLTKRQEWQREFNDLVNDTNNQLNYICDSEKRVNYYQLQFQRLHEKFRRLCERYVFYRRLMNAQKTQPTGFDNEYVLDGSISGGFKTYYQSSVVMQDYGQYANALHTDLPHKKEKEFLVYWIWDITGDQTKYNWRYVWFEAGWKNTYKSICRDKAYPTVGSKKIHWHFEGGTWRRAEWFYKNKIIFMPLSNYPFVGLND